MLPARAPRQWSWTPARAWLVVLGGILMLLGAGGSIPPVVAAAHALGFHLEGGEAIVHWLVGAAAFTLVLLWRNDRTLGRLDMGLGLVIMIGSLALYALVPREGPWHLATSDTAVHLALGFTCLATGLLTVRTTNGARPRAPAGRPPAA